jgi:hypothetical protein
VGAAVGFGDGRKVGADVGAGGIDRRIRPLLLPCAHLIV